MAWEWSHSQEAYSNCRENILHRDREWLEVVYAEWVVRRFLEDENDWDSDKYTESLEHAKTLAEDVLADYIWDAMEEQATCDNGGFNAWACPYGCGPHLVSFDKENDDA